MCTLVNLAAGLILDIEGQIPTLFTSRAADATQQLTPKTGNSWFANAELLLLVSDPIKHSKGCCDI